MPNLMLRLGGLFIPAARELREILYQFESPFVINSQETTDVFGLHPTALTETIDATLASYGHLRGSDLHV